MRADAMLLKKGEGLVKRHVQLADPQELIDILSPDGLLFQRQDRHDYNWVFRGQSDATWDLSPSAHRGDRVFGHYKFTPQIGWPLKDLTPRQRAAEELQLIVSFADAAENAGHALPGDNPVMRDADTRWPALTCAQFPPISLRWIAALAQHSGVPTRFLDWSYHFLTACFFAARHPAREIRRVGQNTEGRDRANQLHALSERRFAVWALSRAFLQALDRRANPGAIVVTAPTASNPNLQRQAGLFTLVRYRKEPAKWRHIPSLDALFAQRTAVDIPKKSGLPNCHALYQFTLPWSCAGKFLHILNGYGVNALQLFDGLGVAEEHLRDQAAYIY